MYTTKEINIKLQNKFPFLEIISEYKGANLKVDIKCNDCGKIFSSVARSVISSKHGCPFCKVQEAKFKNAKDQFIKKLNNTNFSLVSYVSWKDVEVKCNTCGITRHTTADNIFRFSCKHCSSLAYGNTLRSDTETFIKKASMIHNNLYDYSKVNYVDCKTKVEIICKNHGSFYQTPLHHLRKEGCPKCKATIGEKDVRNFLLKHNITFKEQYYIKPFKVDFYLPNDNVIIEYNGLQHYRPINYFGGIPKFIKQQQRDLDLKNYCSLNNITLIEIPYNEDIN